MERTEQIVVRSEHQMEVLTRFKAILPSLYDTQLPQEQIEGVREEHSQIFNEAYTLGLIKDLIKITDTYNIERQLQDDR